jgi:hypothetical protein
MFRLIMSRFAVSPGPGRRTASVLAAIALAAAGSAAASPAAHADTVHGCPSGDLCTYSSQSDYDNSDIDIATLEKLEQGFTLLQTASASAVVVNNSSSTALEYTSEGTVLVDTTNLYHFGLDVCVFVPDPLDEQSPDSTEDPADGFVESGVGFGTTPAHANAARLLPASACGL